MEESGGARSGPMSKPVSYTPPDASRAPDGPVRRRHVFYLPGYDPEARSRYRLLFVRELTLYAKRFGGGKREVGRASLSADGLVQSWRVKAHPATEGAETSYDVLLWDDIVARDAARSKFVSVALLVIGTLHALVAGKLAAFYRLNWKYGNIIVYPFVMLMLLGAAAALIGFLVHAWLGEGVAGSGPLPSWLTLACGLLAGLASIRAAERLVNRIYFWQLLNDWVFNWQHGQGWRADYAARLDLFVDRIAERLEAFSRKGERIDEILILGHSTGALTAVEVAARLIDRDPEIGTRGPTLSLATLGSGMPLVAVQPQAVRVRADIASLVASRRIAWVDYVAPQDWVNFPRFNPVFDLDLPLEPSAILANPTIRSARFRDIIDEETYRKVRFRPFRMHFQFLMANDRPGDYDFFAMTLGPQTLGARALGKAQTLSIPAACETVAA